MIDHDKLEGCCSGCDMSFKIIENGFVHVDLEDNGICLQCYDFLISSKLSKKFRKEWIGNPRDKYLDIYE